MMRILWISSALLATFFLFSAPVQAQATRTWVSGVGDDANPCSRTAPCKTFAGAISKTAASGEISVLDPGGYGSLTITKSISLVAAGVEGSVLATGTNGIVINAGPTDVVSIHGLMLEGSGTGTNGIRIVQAGSVYISNTVIRGFHGSPGYGVDIESVAGNPKIYLKDVEINGNVTGLYAHGVMTNVGVVFDNCTIFNNSTSAITFDTSTSIGRALGSSFATTPTVIMNGAQLISGGNNFFSSGGPTSTSPLQ